MIVTYDRPIPVDQEVTFLYPEQERFPIDPIAITIVKELEKRNFTILGLDIHLRTYGAGNCYVGHVDSIIGPNFRVKFCRGQGKLPGGEWYDTAAISKVHFNKKYIELFGDSRTINLATYVGMDWDKDRDWFLNAFGMVNAKLNNEPRRYLKYSGIDKLRHDDDLGREYDPIDEPWEFHASEIFSECIDFLQKEVLDIILKTPEVKERIKPFKTEEAIPFPEHLGDLYCFADRSTAVRVKYRDNPEVFVRRPHPYAHKGRGASLCDGYTLGDDCPKEAKGSFLWCNMGEISDPIDMSSYRFPEELREHEGYLFRIRPTHANHIYVVDHAPYKRRRQEICDAFPHTKRFTREQVIDFISARARTLVPIQHYAGGYEEPYVLIKREIGYDEMELVQDIKGRLD